MPGWREVPWVINTSDKQGAGFAADVYGRVQRARGSLCHLQCGRIEGAERGSRCVCCPRSWSLPELPDGRNGSSLCSSIIRFGSMTISSPCFVISLMLQPPMHDSTIACQEIDRVISAVITQKRLGYIELPRDMVSIISQSAPVFKDGAPGFERSPALIEEIVSTLNSAERPVILAGSGITRSGLGSVLKGLAEKANIPIISVFMPGSSGMRLSGPISGPAIACFSWVSC